MKKEMKKIFNRLVIFGSFCLVGCTDTLDNVKKGLGGGKRVSTDEFLVKKKDPLTMPPKWNELPQPGESLGAGTEGIAKEVTDIEDLLKKNGIQSDVNESESSASLEDSILKKIKKK